MNEPHDPVRWLSSVESAPDVLRATLRAAQNEGPSELQMRALAIKLAALSAGAATAATAASAKAAATGAGAATAKVTGALTATKVFVSLAVVGVTTAGVLWTQQRQAERTAPRPAAQAPAVATGSDPALETLEASAGEHANTGGTGELPARSRAAEPSSTRAHNEPEAAPTPSSEPAPHAAERPQVDAPATVDTADRTDTPSRPGRSAARVKPARGTRSQSARPAASLEVERADHKVPSEVELLRRARAALGTRPREAFALTEQHRDHYPRGTFVQERDALAIEALMRAGDLDMARDLAQRFVRDYPSSPHAHRFRETMGIR